MKYYEKEVLSIPAGTSKKTVDKYLIYECPDSSAYNYQKPIFVTFRASGGGEMDRLYKIEEIISLNPSKQEDIENILNSDINQSFKVRLKDLIENSPYRENQDELRKYYILSKKEQIELKHKPKPEKNNVKFTYYKLAEILNENKKIVSRASME